MADQVQPQEPAAPTQWTVVNPWLTEKNKSNPVHAAGAVVSTADLGAPKGITPEQFAKELVMIGAIAPVVDPNAQEVVATETAPEQAPAPTPDFVAPPEAAPAPMAPDGTPVA